MSSLDSISTPPGDVPRRTLLYGVQGIGKSTWASKWPGPVFVPTEDGLSNIDCRAFPLAKRMTDVQGYILDLGGEEHPYKTVVLDSADWFEKLIWQSVCREHSKESIADFGYGKGYALAVEKFRKCLRDLDQCRTRGMHIVVIAHCAIVRFESPEGESYDRYQPRLHRECAALIQEWADEVLFANYQTFTRKTDEGFGRERNIAVGDAKRILYTQEKPAYLAKSRLPLPPEMSFEFEEYAKFLVSEKKETVKK